MSTTPEPDPPDAPGSPGNPGTPGSSGFTVASTETMAAHIASARQRVVFVGPALWDEIATALLEAFMELGPDRVTVIVDVDPEVYRLGYGQFAALERLDGVMSAFGHMVLRQPGVRIGLLITDDRTLVYAPQPQLVESPASDPQRPNAIVLGPPPAAVSAALGLGPAGLSAQTVGLDKADHAGLEAVKRDLDANPPQPFDLSRKVRVFNSYLEFVELRLEGGQIARRELALPSHLLGVADPVTRRRLDARLRLFDGQDDELSGRTLTQDRKVLESRYLRRLPGYGTLIRRADKPAFTAAVEEFREMIEGFRTDIQEKLEKRVQTVRNELKAALLPGLTAQPPEAWTRSKWFKGPGSAGEFLDTDLDRVFAAADRFLTGIRLDVRFKAVTFETLNDPDFIDAARRAFPDLPEAHTEADAVEATADPTPAAA